MYCSERGTAYLVADDEFDERISLRVDDGGSGTTVNPAGEYELAARRDRLT